MRFGFYFLMIWLGLMLLAALSSQAQELDTCTTLYADTLPDGVIHFIDSTTIEATSKAGDVMRWSLETGQPIEP